MDEFITDHNPNSLKSFKIYGLFGYQDIELPLDRQVLILIAENGSGKTTLLNSLYYALTQNLDKLKRIDYQKIELSFISDDNEIVTASINKKDIQDLIKKSLTGQAKRLQEFLSKYGELRSSKEFILSLDWMQLEISKKPEIKSKWDTFVDTIKINLSDHLFYFPTYRRIEEDLSSLGYNNLELEDDSTKLIQFGMDDVKQKFKDIQEEIKETAFNSFSEVTGEMLTQFIEGIKITEEMKASIKPDILDIILSRVGEKNIPLTEQEKIKNLVSSGNINDPKYSNLIYFLSKLIDLYEQQRKIDEAIKSFVRICNKYLKPRKEIIYNESTAEIYIRQTRNNEPIDLTNLSSGEKQIISLFSKVYLESQEEFILIIDEPELSLSVEWQEMLLPDIIDSGRCKLLIAATHSPFIFNNKLDSYAVDLDQFVTEN